ncbi:MAG: hypothetical protein PHQ19_00170 [Candidatus Krumholzibacteria bacterium]|nr:hypothetical protein [Candidatus Krumholzibacteria bacterium]
MKTIVVSGARSNVGKTTLARHLCRLLPGAVHVKLGHGREKPDAGNLFYPVGTPFGEIAAGSGPAPFLVIESNRILEEIRPDLAIFLPADDPKPSAKGARERADYIRGEPLPCEAAEDIARRLGVALGTAREIARRIAGDPGDRERNTDEES